MNFNQLNKHAIFVSKEVYGKALGNDDFDYVEPTRIDGTGIAKERQAVLILGINPSRSDPPKPFPFLFCIPKCRVDKKDSHILDGMINKNFVYNNYFCQNYELVREFGYGLLWENPTYLNRNKSSLTNEEYNFLRKIAKERKRERYVIFSDLFFARHTNAKDFKNVFFNSGIRNQIKKLLLNQLKYFNPKLVIVTNAQASKFIIDEFNGGELQTEVTVNNIPFILAGMVSGQGGMDRYSLLRLKRDIKRILQQPSTPPRKGLQG